METAMKKLREGVVIRPCSDMNADMSTEAAEMATMAIDKYIATQNWEVSIRLSSRRSRVLGPDF